MLLSGTYYSFHWRGTNLDRSFIILVVIVIRTNISTQHVDLKPIYYWLRIVWIHYNLQLDFLVLIHTELDIERPFGQLSVLCMLRSCHNVSWRLIQYLLLDREFLRQTDLRLTSQLSSHACLRNYISSSKSPWSHQMSDQSEQNIPFVIYRQARAACSSQDSANTIRWPDVELMLGHCRRRWANINPTSGQRLVFAVGPACDSDCEHSVRIIFISDINSPDYFW